VNEPAAHLRLLPGGLPDEAPTAEELADLQRRAWFDALTGAANRERFLDLVAAALRGRSPQFEVGLVYADLDHFKHHNDLGGHAYGDRVLRTVTSRWRARLRSTDVIGRIGGDEFAVLCTGAVGQVLQVAERVVAALEDPVCVPGGTACVRATVGVAIAASGTTSAVQLLAAADAQMYAKKRQRPAASDAQVPVLALLDRLEALAADRRQAVPREELAALVEQLRIATVPGR
jgi:diguanylate cyclase (GGDEF)-like protein